MAAFEVFKRQAPPGAHEPVVTVQRQGLLTLNRAAHEALGAPAASLPLRHDPAQSC